MKQKKIALILFTIVLAGLAFDNNNNQIQISLCKINLSNIAKFDQK